MRAALRDAGVSVFVVDEAHCIGGWGPDFRPDYQRLGEVIDELGHPVVIALTATAAPPVRAEIVERLGMVDAAVEVEGFDRPDITSPSSGRPPPATRTRPSWHMPPSWGGRAPASSTSPPAGGPRGSPEAIDATGVRAAAYHAGLPRAQRDRAHDRFLDGMLDVVVATNAFGMGIDKPDVRFVLHADVPESVDAYYQEIGRAGRGGRPAQAVLYFRDEDRACGATWAPTAPCGATTSPPSSPPSTGPGERAATDELRDAAELGPRKLTQVLDKLSDAGAVEVAGDEVVVTGDVDAGELIGAVEADPAASPFPPGTDVAHAEFGEGHVMRSDGDTLTVLFEGGYGNLSLAAVLERGLLTPTT